MASDQKTDNDNAGSFNARGKTAKKVPVRTSPRFRPADNAHDNEWYKTLKGGRVDKIIQHND